MSQAPVQDLKKKYQSILPDVAVLAKFANDLHQTLQPKAGFEAEPGMFRPITTRPIHAKPLEMLLEHVDEGGRDSYHQRFKQIENVLHRVIDFHNRIEHANGGATWQALDPGFTGDELATLKI